ncbi:hypothetical protein WMY93_015605 [Mugilogobius chulae]|uniref:UPAR/Ly6 domain-containing protein n=1 Tax=Mugilogobius chulae TaxID=88201 RepID=A0AAW0NUY5_9GOBI
MIRVYPSLIHSLKCHACAISVLNKCAIGLKMDCKSGQQCYTGKGKKVGFIDAMEKGCLDVGDCNRTASVNVPGTEAAVYSMTRTCCTTDLCNSAPTSLPAVLQLALASVAAVFGANALV